MEAFDLPRTYEDQVIIILVVMVDSFMIMFVLS